MAYNSPDDLSSDSIFHHLVPSASWVTLIISYPTYSCLRTFELAIPSAWKWLRWCRICLQGGKSTFDPWVRRIPWRREWLPIPVFLLGEFHGQRNLVGYIPWGHTESETIEWLTLSLRIWKIQQCWCLNLLKSNLDAEKHHLKCYINFHHTHIIQKHFPLIKIFSSCLMGNNEISWERSSRETFPFYLSK